MDSLEELTQNAAVEAKAAAARAERIRAAPASSSTVRTGLLVAVIVACVAAIAWQASRFGAPFPQPQAGADAAVAQVDLEVIAGMVEAFKLSQGRYPSTLGEVRLPETLAEFVREQTISYQTTPSAFTLEWSLPRMKATLDGATMQTRVEAMGR